MAAADIIEVSVQLDIRAPRARVYQAISQEVSDWWPQDCLALDGGEMKFECWAGGRLFVENVTGDQILWGTVAAISAGSSIDIVSHTMMHYGGPGIWFWRMELLDGQEGTTDFRLQCSIVGRGCADDTEGGWRQIFAGLKSHCEAA